jgi:putative DNA primase/helicase
MTAHTDFAPATARITLWKNREDKIGRTVEGTWQELFREHFSTARKYSGDDVLPGWSPATFDGAGRRKANARDLCALVLDYDNTCPLDEAIELWSIYWGIAHTSKSHTEEANRFRVVLPLSRFVTPGEHAEVWAWANQLACGKIDGQCKDASRFWYLPVRKGGGIYKCVELSGEVLDVDAVLESARTAQVEDEEREMPPVREYQPFDYRGDTREQRRVEKYLAKAIENGCNELRSAGRGQRNNTASSVAFSLGGLVGGGYLTEEQVFDALFDATKSAGWDRKEERRTSGTIRRQIRFGAQKPRMIPPSKYQVIDGGQSSGVSPAAARPESEQSAPAVTRVFFERGDHVELAEQTRLRLATSPLTYDEGSFWRYDQPRGVWDTLPIEYVEHVASGFAGHETGPNHKPLSINDSALRGASRILRNTLLSRDDRAQFSKGRPGVVFANGFATLQGGKVELVGHDPDYAARHAFPFEYAPDMRHDALDQFFEDIFADVSEEERGKRVMLIQEFVGACLTGIVTGYEKAIFLLGDGGNGKSQLIEIIRALFPPQSVGGVKPTDWGEKFRVAALGGKLINICTELPDDRDIVSGDTFKAIVSGEEIQVEHKHRDPFQMKPMCGHLFSTNVLPPTTDFTRGFWRRMHVVLFTRRMDLIPGSRPNFAREVISTELAGVLAWALHGAARLQAQGRYTVPDTSVDALRDWRRDVDPVMLFLDTAYPLDAYECAAGSLYAEFARWAKDNGFMQMSSTKFGRRVLTTGNWRRVHTRSGNIYAKITPSGREGL